MLVYGGAALAAVDQETADVSVQEALDAGINHFDVAADYGDAELRLAPWLPRIRSSIFLSTKTGMRDRDAAWQEINRSLERLGTDSIDLIQLHSVGNLDVLDQVTARGGALEAALRAQVEGIAGSVGITGHSHTAPRTHLEALRRHPFATVLTPLNLALWKISSYRADYETLVAEAQRQDAGLMTIKTVSRRNWPEGADTPYATWYEPHDQPERIAATVSWSLARSEITGLATPGDVRLLRYVIAAEGARMTTAEAEALMNKDFAYSSPFESMPAGFE